MAIHIEYNLLFSRVTDTYLESTLLRATHNKLKHVDFHLLLFVHRLDVAKISKQTVLNSVGDSRPESMDFIFVRRRCWLGVGVDVSQQRLRFVNGILLKRLPLALQA